MFSYVEYRDCCSFNASYIEVTPSYRRLADTLAGGTAFCAFGVQPPIFFQFFRIYFFKFTYPFLYKNKGSLHFHLIFVDISKKDKEMATK